MISRAVIILVYFTAASCSNVTVSPSSSCSTPCESVVLGTSIDQALGSATTGDVIQLLPGCHCVRTFNVVKDVTNVSLIGVTGTVTIKCAPGVGLAFLNVSRLSFQGFAITGCSANGSSAVALHSALNQMVDLFTMLTENVSFALAIGNCTDVAMDHVTIVNTTGLGLIGVNVAGQSNFTNNVFSFNIDRQCLLEGSGNFVNTVGGGASFTYVNYADSSNKGPVFLTIDNSSFSYNSYCGAEVTLEIYGQVIDALRGRSYIIGSGGGISLSFAQNGYAVNVNVLRTAFERNEATVGSGSYVLWYTGASDSHIVFSDCAFTANGGRLLTGGSIGMFKDIDIPFRNATVGSPRPNTLTVLRSNFTQNTANSGGGIYVQSLYSTHSSFADKLTLDSCRFVSNSGLRGAAVYLIERKGHGTQNGLSATVRDCTFVSNAMDRSQVTTPSSLDSIVQAITMNVTITDSAFLSNAGTAVGASDSLIILEGDVVFYNNSALSGGAIQLLSATLLLVRNNSHIVFRNNSATISGAAIYTDYTYGLSDVDSYYDCFLYLVSPSLICTADYPCLDLTTANISMEFMYNRAPLGSVLYGSTLDICSWAFQLKMSLNVSASAPIFQVMYERSLIFHLDRSPNNPQVFSTPPSVLDVGSSSAAFSSMPGQQFTLAIRSADRLNHTIQTVVTAQTFGDFFPKLGDSGYWLTSTTPNAVAKVYGRPNVTMNVTLYSLDTYIQSSPITITLTECLFGFVYTETETDGGNCHCSNATALSTVTCDEDLKLFNVTYGWWVGPDKPGGTGLVYKPCLFDYCATQDYDGKYVTVLPQAMDAQCADDRAGLLCGGCREGYSAVFGTNRCMKCSNDTLALLVFFAAAGIGIVAIISFLHITISDGYINGLLFYVSIVSSYEVHFTGRFPGREVFIPIFLLNLDMGFETCFYDGMTSLDRVGLNLVFPIYLFVLMIIFIWLASRSFVVSQWLAKSSFTPSKLLATLITLSYNSITQSCFLLLGLINVTVYQPDGKSSFIRLWSIDPTVDYFSLRHSILFIVSVVLLILFVIPVPIILILPSFTSRLVWRLKPLYDAFVSPLKDTFAFWIGLRFILRIIYFIISSFSEPPLNILLLGVGLVLALFVTTSVQPYKSTAHNILDSFYHCNILTLAIGALYFQNAENSEEMKKAELAFVFIVVGVAYIASVFVLGKVILLRFPRLTERLVGLCKKHHKKGPTQKVPQLPTNDDNGDAIEEPQIHSSSEHEKKAAMPQLPVPMFSLLREPLLDGVGEMELK